MAATTAGRPSAKARLDTYKKRKPPGVVSRGTAVVSEGVGAATQRRGQPIDTLPGERKGQVKQGVNPRLKQRVTGALLERTEGRAKRLGVDLKGPVTRAQARELRGELRARREGTGDKELKPGATGSGTRVKDKVTSAIAERTRARQRKLGLPASGPVTKKSARLALQQMRDARGVTVKDGEKTTKRTQPHGRAEKLTRLGVEGTNYAAPGPGHQRAGQEYEVGYDPLKGRYAHTYGQGTEEEKRVYLKKSNPWTKVYGKPQKAAARYKKRAKKLATT